MSGKPPPLEFEDVAVQVGGQSVLRGVDLTLAPGEIVGLVGRNGAGKTTLLRVASRVLQPQRGRVRVGGLPLESLSRRALATRVAVVPQDVSIPFPFRAGEVVLMGRSPHLGTFGFESSGDVERARSAMAQVGVEHLADRSMLELSGGERQLVLVARALVQDPAVLLLDEPTAHLDLRHRLGVLERVRDFAEAGRSALVVSHDLALAARGCTRLALLTDGRVLDSGAPERVLTPGNLRTVFDIEADVVTAPDGSPLVVPRSTGIRRQEVAE
jgi:iron complex transport system ATP-binding protein